MIDDATAKDRLKILVDLHIARARLCRADNEYRKTPDYINRGDKTYYNANFRKDRQSYRTRINAELKFLVPEFYPNDEDIKSLWKWK